MRLQKLISLLLMVLGTAGVAAIAWQLQAWRYGLRITQQLQMALHHQRLEQTKRLIPEQQLSASDQ